MIFIITSFRKKEIVYDDFSIGEIIKRNQLFKEFIKNKKSINLILGSSIAESAIDPISLGSNWFLFSNSIQNIYESYIFLDHYKDSIKIDTILTVIQPFDFAYSYVKDRKKDLPGLNGGFYIFKKDSITTLKLTLRNKIQKLREMYLPDIDYYIRDLKEVINTDTWTSQGSRINSHIHTNFNLSDSIKMLNNYESQNRHNYFYNVRKLPNMKYLDTYNNLIISLKIKSIFIQLPFNYIYRNHLIKYKDDIVLNNIEDSLNQKNIIFWNYKNSQIFKGFKNYSDPLHLSSYGRRRFTSLLKERFKAK
jgi:hypothetical protein